MKVLIGTPIHEIKDYSMQRWLANVTQLNYPADLLLVDNSEGHEYVETVKSYCKKYGITNYSLTHIDVYQSNGADERIGRSREVIRQKVISDGYDAWFSWESDHLIPANALNELILLMNSGNYMMVCHKTPSGLGNTKFKAAFGVALVKRELLEKYGFLLEYPDMPDCWHAGELWFKKQILQGGGNYIEVDGIVDPIHHLDNPEA